MGRGRYKFTAEEKLHAIAKCIDNFWLRVNKKSCNYPHKKAIKEYPEIAGTQCWEWIGCFSGNYGNWNSGRRHLGDVSAHRISWKLKHGKIPKSKPCVMHKCDNPKCVRPKHLKLGTAEANSKDMYAKDRDANRKGENHGRCKTTEKQVIHILKLISKGYSLISISNYLGIPEGRISDINRGASWKHVPRIY